MNNTFYIYTTDFGKLLIKSDGEAITGIKIVADTKLIDRTETDKKSITKKDVKAKSVGKNESTELTDKAAKQLDEFFAGKRKHFDLPLLPKGTDFQRSVWKALQEIPYGETRSYKQIAEAINNPKACRAVGLANNRNPIWIVIPCHRVIGSNGALTGYGGGLEMKQRLLEIEKR